MSDAENNDAAADAAAAMRDAVNAGDLDAQVASARKFERAIGRPVLPFGHPGRYAGPTGSDRAAYLLAAVILWEGVDP